MQGSWIVRLLGTWRRERALKARRFSKPSPVPAMLIGCFPFDLPWSLVYVQRSSPDSSCIARLLLRRSFPRIPPEGALPRPPAAAPTLVPSEGIFFPCLPEHSDRGRITLRPYSRHTPCRSKVSASPASPSILTKAASPCASTAAYPLPSEGIFFP